MHLATVSVREKKIYTLLKRSLETLLKYFETPITQQGGRLTTSRERKVGHCGWPPSVRDRLGGEKDRQRYLWAFLLDHSDHGHGTVFSELSGDDRGGVH